MKLTYKAIIFYDGNEYNAYVEAENKTQAEKIAKLKFMQKHNLKKAKLTIHASAISDTILPIVHRPSFKRMGTKPDGRPNWRIKMVKERIEPKEFKYRVTVMCSKDGSAHTISVDVMAYNSDNALIAGKRALAGKLIGYKVIGWAARR
jgi:hypothetical protein